MASFVKKSPHAETFLAVVVELGKTLLEFFSFLWI